MQINIMASTSSGKCIMSTVLKPLDSDVILPNLSLVLLYILKHVCFVSQFEINK